MKAVSRASIHDLRQTSLSVLTRILTPGFVVSDWGATHDSVEDNVDAGLDME